MILTRSVFDRLRNSSQLTLILVGMSNMGKTYWSLKLADLGFQHLYFDDRIAQRLKAFLEPQGFEGVEGVAQWMGQPYSEGYRDREQIYLQAENEVGNEIHQALLSSRSNAVVDSTGSFIYTNSLHQLVTRGLVVYLQEDLDALEEIFQRYIDEPKPVLWGQHFSQNEGEDRYSALARCFPELLEFRLKRYQAIADVAIPYKIACDNNLTAEKFLEEIHSRLT